MQYFRNAHSNIRVVHALDDKPGLRKSQVGALHSISAHITLRSDPGLIVLPTGAGKTAVLMLVPYLVPSNRVLIITQSRFVREQIAKDFSTLRTLKEVGALPGDFHSPTVIENKNMVRSAESWERFRDCDVVISTPNGASPGFNAIPVPPADLFDLVLVDEAHHSPAPTWNALIRAFPSAQCVFFTATPFRRDRKEIKAKHLYTYPIQRAFDDGIYGDMIFLPVSPSAGEAADEVLARKAEEVYRADKEAGFEHSIMIRADSRPRARHLMEVYSRVTNLRLEVVDSGQSARTAEKVVAKLRAGELDGVICVNMLGEGFDLPRLKIAALHAPHRSLGVTLQFFGRFARVNGQALGEAKFLAIPAEMEGELAELYEESNAWGKKIRRLGQERISAELATREILDAFEQSTADAETPLQDISLYSFTVFNHVKVHEVYGDICLHAQPQVAGFITARTWVNEEQSTVVFLLREETRPQWATTPGLDRVEHHLVILYWDDKAKLLFVCSSYREESLYKEIVGRFVTGSFKTLSLSKTNRVLRPFRDLELFNVGIRNRATGVVAESYRQISGSSAHQALDKGDAALYHRGHIFGRGHTPYGVTTIGVSSLGKIWRLESTKIPEFIKWCHSLAREIENPAPFTTGIAIDHFDAGRDIDQVPDVPILAADWDEQVYGSPWTVSFTDGGGTDRSLSVLDLDILVEPTPSDTTIIHFVLEYQNFRTRLVYTIAPIPAVKYADDNEPRMLVTRGFSRKDFVDYLTEEHLRFHLGDGSVLQGTELFSPMGEEETLFDAATLAEVVDWDAANVNIEKEFGICHPGRSIHDWLKDTLVGTDASVILYDHRPGECADYLVIGQDQDGKATIALYHCKASGGPKPGDRAEDAYEVCGQAIKSAKFRNRKKLIKHVKQRIASGSIFIKGSMEVLLDLLEPDPRYEIGLQVYVVQPGISRAVMTQKIASLLAAVNRGLVSVGCAKLRILCSA